MRSGPDAPAEARARARVHFDQGARAYREGRFDDAIERFQAAYELDPSGALLLNIAQSHRRRSPPDCTAALRHYELYLAADPRAPERPEVERYMAAMRSCIEDARRTAAPAPAGEAAGPSPAGTVVGVAAEREPAAPRSRAWAYLAGAGGLVLMAGGALYARAVMRFDELEPQCPCDGATIDRWQALTNVSYAMMGAGAVIGASGLLWRWWPSRPDERRGLVWLEPSATGVILRGRF